jgi:hypothetical protein
LNAPAFGQWTDISHVEAETVDQFGDLGLCGCVVSSDRERSSVPRTRRCAVGPRELLITTS